MLRAPYLPFLQAFVEYLLADGVTLRSDSGAVRALTPCVAATALTRRGGSQLPRRTAADPFQALDDSAFSPDDEASEDEDAAGPHFPELEAAIEAAIERLGGAVFPKLNWSAPKACLLLLCATRRCLRFD